MGVTIRAVAEAAGVSISTVSRALSAAADSVAPETRDHVRRIADELGYRPNPAARGLITGQTHCIGLVVPDLENPFFASVCKAVQERARRAGYSVFVADSDEDPTLEDELVHSLVKQVDGIIFASARGADDAVQRWAQQAPLVLLNREVEGVASVTYDNAGGLRAIVQHLVALGHRTIAYAGGPERSWSSRQRREAFLAADQGTPDLATIDLGFFPPSFEGGVQAADLAIAAGATAVVGYNDLMAVGLIHRLRQRGLRVPEDVSVSGFDNIPISTMIWPNLTTIDNPRTQIGKAGVDWIVGSLRGQKEPVEPTDPIPVQLIVRGSTGVAPHAPDHARSARATSSAS